MRQKEGKNVRKDSGVGRIIIDANHAVTFSEIESKKNEILCQWVRHWSS